VPNYGIEQQGGMNGLPVVLSDNYKDMFDRLVQSQKLFKASEILVQVYASWIIHNALWQHAEESYYTDIQTGAEYQSPDDCSKARRKYLRYQSRRLYKSQHKFFMALNKEVPFFNAATFMSRHRAIMGELRVWAIANETDNIPEEIFARVCEDIMLNGRSISIDLTRAFFENQGGTLTLRDGAPLEALGVDVDADDEGFEVAVAQKLTEVLAETHNDIRDGAGRTSVGNRVRRQILLRGTITPYVGDGGRIGMYYEPPEAMKDGISILEPPERYLIKIFDEDGKELLPPDLGDDVRDWLRKSFRIPGDYHLVHQPWDKTRKFSF